MYLWFADVAANYIQDDTNLRVHLLARLIHSYNQESYKLESQIECLPGVGRKS